MGVCYSTHNSADCCCDDPCCGPICDCCCDRRRFYPWGPRVIGPPPILPIYPPGNIGIGPGPIIIQPTPIPPPIIPYPSTRSYFSQVPVHVPISNHNTSYPPTSQKVYSSPPQLPRYPSNQQRPQLHDQQSYLGPPAESPAAVRPTHRSSSRQSYEHQHRDRRYSLEERVTGYSPTPHHRHLTPEPSSHRPYHYRSASTSDRLPDHHQIVVYQEGEGSSSEERQKYSRPIHRGSASTSAQPHHHHQQHHHRHRQKSNGQVYLSLGDNVPNPPRRSFDHSSREHPDRPQHRPSSVQH
ncbi:uncharacterized protein IL334_007216 [Kwoniella shivajii]|uniref:Uncharacterized protein n=1 Tax=Kwoniella shivajii TaxID=564305 RepID=A0ABZ1DB71_9TREE|nr:hypothetical protein IL334_007216 [Kwoniella shivajii]